VIVMDGRNPFYAIKWIPVQRRGGFFFFLRGEKINTRIQHGVLLI